MVYCSVCFPIKFYTGNLFRCSCSTKKKNETNKSLLNDNASKYLGSIFETIQMNRIDQHSTYKTSKIIFVVSGACSFFFSLSPIERTKKNDANFLPVNIDESFYFDDFGGEKITVLPLFLFFLNRFLNTKSAK